MRAEREDESSPQAPDPGARYNPGMTPQPAPDRSTLGFESGRSYVDPVIEAYKKGVDRTLIREMLKLTPEQRILRLQ